MGGGTGYKKIPEPDAERTKGPKRAVLDNYTPPGELVSSGGQKKYSKGRVSFRVAMVMEGGDGGLSG